MRKLIVSRVTVIMFMMLLGITLILAACDIELPEDRWATFHNDALNTGYSLSGGVDDGEVSWTYVTDSPVTSSPVYRYDKVFVTDSGGVVYCLKKSGKDGTGQLEWRYPAQGSIGSELTTPAAVGHKVYVGSDDGHVYAIKEGSGELKWQYPAAGQSPLMAFHSSPTVAYGKVFIGCDDGNLYVLDDGDGELKYTVPTDGAIKTAVAAKFNRIYFGSEDGHMYCWNEDKEEMKWQYPAVGQPPLMPIHSSPAVGGDEVYFGCDDGYVYCVDEDDAKFYWSYDTEGAVYSSPALGYSQVFVGSDSGHVYALEDNDDGGELRWQYPLANESPLDPVRSSPALADHNVYVVSENGYLYGFDEHQNRERLEFAPAKLGEPSGDFISSPAIANKRLIVGTDSGITVFKD